MDRSGLVHGKDCGAFITVKSVDTNLFVGTQVWEREYMNPKKETRKPCKIMPYSRGQLNRLVDGLVHPLYEKSELYRVADGLLHGVVERNMRVSAKKFVRYNLPEVVKKILEEI
jgi:hypothetical protein